MKFSYAQCVTTSHRKDKAPMRVPTKGGETTERTKEGWPSMSETGKGWKSKWEREDRRINLRS